MLGKEYEYDSATPLRVEPASSIGFVYLLGNRAMPGLYKIGCTERSPSRRAGELSKATAAPTHFDVICYWEGERFQEFEKELHSYHSDGGFNNGREFFTGPLVGLVDSIIHGWDEFRHSACTTAIGSWYIKYED